MRFYCNVIQTLLIQLLEKQELIDKDNQVLLKKLVEIQAGRGVRLRKSLIRM